MSLRSRRRIPPSRSKISTPLVFQASSWSLRWCALGHLGALLSVFGGSASGKPERPAARGAVPVTVATVLQKTVPVLVRAIGAVEAYSTIVVKSQVEGELMCVHFKEGQDVKKGDPLFAIDPRPFEAALKQVEANLARDTAQAKNAEVDARRYAELLRRRLVAQADYDQQRTNAHALQAAVRVDQAAMDTVARQTLRPPSAPVFRGRPRRFKPRCRGWRCCCA